MNKTIMAIVSMVFAFFFLVFIIGLVPKLLNTNDSKTHIDTVQARVIDSALVVSWETERETDGILHYLQGTASGYVRDQGFSMTHRLTTPPLNGEVTYYIESCDIMGACAVSEEEVITI